MLLICCHVIFPFLFLSYYKLKNYKHLSKKNYKFLYKYYITPVKLNKFDATNCVENVEVNWEHLCIYFGIVTPFTPFGKRFIKQFNIQYV